MTTYGHLVSNVRMSGAAPPVGSYHTQGQFYLSLPQISYHYIFLSQWFSTRV